MAGFHLWYQPDAQCDDIKVKITCKTKRSKERRHQNPGSANDGQLHQQLSDPEHLHNFFNHSLICDHGSLLQHFLSKVLIHEFITREARREATKEVRRSKIEGRSSRSKKGAAERERSVSSSARNSGEVKKAEELEKRPLADILVYVLFSSLNYCFDQIFGERLSFDLAEPSMKIETVRRDAGPDWQSVKAAARWGGWVGIVTLTDQPARQAG